MSGITVVVVNDFGHVNGGASQVALSSALGLAEAGYDVRLFVAVAPVLAEITAAGIPVVCTQQKEIANHPDVLRAASQGLWNGKAAALFRKLLNELDPATTVIHLHSWTKALSSSVIRECIRLGFRLTCTLHDYFLVCPNGGLFNYQTKEICALKPMSLQCMTTHCDARRYSHKVWRVVRQSVQERIAKFPAEIDDLIVVSEFSKEVFERHLPGSKRLHLVPNPVNIASRDRVPVAENEHFVFVGRLSPEKGPLVFARAARSLGLQPVFIGDGELRGQILEICPDAIITGWVAPDEVHRRLRQARAVVFPTLLYETQGLVVSEGLALGIPAIVSNTSAASRLITPDRNGYHFDAGDDRDLAEKLRRLSDRTLVSDMGAKAYEAYWTAPVHMKGHIQALGAVYKAMLEPLRSTQPASS